MIRSFYELKIITALTDEKIERYDFKIKNNGKKKVVENYKLEIKKSKIIDKLFTHINDYRNNMNNSQVERKLYSQAFINLEALYSEKYKAYINFSIELFAVRINALRAKYEKVKLINPENIDENKLKELIDSAFKLEVSASELLEQMNVYICSHDKLQPLHIVELYYQMSNYFHSGNRIATQYKLELTKRLRPQLTEALQNFNFTLAKELLVKIKELS